MKHAKYIFSIIFFIPLCLSAQREAKNIIVSIPKPIDVYVADNENELAYIIQSKKQYQITFVNSKYETTKNIIVNRPVIDKNETILGTSLRESELVIHLYNSKSRSFSSININKNTGSHRFSQTGSLTVNDLFVKALEMDSVFYLLTIPKGSNTLQVWKSEYGEAFVPTDYDIDFKDFYQFVVMDNSGRSSNANSAIESVSYELENNIKSTYSKKKLYHFDNKIFMSFDTPDATHLVTIDLIDEVSSYRKLNFSIDRGQSSKSKQGNSFLHNNTFFRVTASPEQINLSVIDLDSMELLNTYNIYPDQEIGINNGPILQENSGQYSGGGDKLIAKPQQFFKKLLSGEVAIAANYTNYGQYEVQIGSYQEYVARSGSYWGPPGLSVGFGSMYAPMGFPGFYGGMGTGFFGWPGYYPNHMATSKRIQTVYFRSLLDEVNFEHQPGGIPKTLRDKIGDYESSAFRSVSPEFIRVNSFNTKVLLGYYLKGRKAYKVIEFDK